MNKITKYLPFVIVGICVIWFIGNMVKIPKDQPGALKIQAFGKLPVIFHGRVKPYDTLARNSLKIVSDRETFVDNQGKTQPAIKWLLDVISMNDASLRYKVFRIENYEILHELGLKTPEEIETAYRENIKKLQTQLASAKSKNATSEIKEIEESIKRQERSAKFHRKQWKFRYAMSEFREKLNILEDHAKIAEGKKQRHRSVYDNKVLELRKQIQLVMRLRMAYQLPLNISHAQLSNLLNNPSEALKLLNDAQQRSIVMYMQESGQYAKFEPPLGIPDDDHTGHDHGVDEGEKYHWKVIPIAFLDTMRRKTQGRPIGLSGESAKAFVDVLAGWIEYNKSKDPAVFNRGVTSLGKILKTPSEEHTNAAKLNTEFIFNHAGPFWYGMFLYLFAMMFGLVSLLFPQQWLKQTAFWMIVFTFVVHTIALITRVYLSGYPPVTNLYSSAIFIGWGAVLFGIIIERIHNLGIGNFIGALVGFSVLLIAQYGLAGDGDTMEMMQAVLDTQFWLWTHVLTITLGYTATFVAGTIGIVFIFAGLFSKALADKKLTKDVTRLIYGVLCFALLLSFVGTVLGGLWADDSWGRFWGWDPKENGALIIVIWNALILHARWGGMIRERGIAVLSVVGNIVTSWSWFGVNQLSVGLHSYGFTDSAAFWLTIFVASQLFIIAIGLLPISLWRSFNTEPEQVKPEKVISEPVSA